MAQVEIIVANLKTNIKNSVKKMIKRVCAYCRVSTVGRTTNKLFITNKTLF